MNYSKVLTIIDPRSKLGCLVQRTRDNGILAGGVSDTDDTAECTVNYLPNVNNIMPGDVIVTSGTDELYPKGLTIGAVTQISLNAGSEGNYAIVAPAVDFLHIEEVLVLRDVVEKASNAAAMLTPTPSPTSTPAPTQDSAVPTINPSTTEEIFVYPSADDEEDDSVTTHLESLPEDNWAAN